MKYIEHDAENLQFYLWCRSYTERFRRLPESEKALSPEWALAKTEADVNAIHHQLPKMNPAIMAALAGTDFEKTPRINVQEDPFGGDWNSMRSPSGNKDEKGVIVTTVVHSPRLDKSMTEKAKEAFDDAGIQWAPFTAQPFRQEVTRIVAAYLAEGSPRQLNLSDRERMAVLHALQNTTHPSAFHAAMSSSEWAVRRQAHPNFIRWSIGNCGKLRNNLAVTLGVFATVASVVAMIIITLSSAHRGWRAVPLIPLFVGISAIYAADKGMCVILHGMHHRQIMPWELFQDHEEDVLGEAREMDDLPADDKSTSAKSGSDESIGRNSYEDEPWVAKYGQRGLLRRMFECEAWIQEPAMRRIQDAIFLQSLLIAAAAGGATTAVFCAVPAGNFF